MKVKTAGNRLPSSWRLFHWVGARYATGVKYDGKVYDCGSKLGFLTANVVFALDRPDLRDAFRKEMRHLFAELNGVA